MTNMRYLGAVSGLCLLALAGPFAPGALAQSGEQRDIATALLTQQHDLAEPLLEVTPSLLSLQQSLVDTLRAKMEGFEEQERVGQRTLSDYLVAKQAYLQELETLQVMEARSKNKSISSAELLKIRIRARGEALSNLNEAVSEAERRYNVGELTRSDVNDAKAQVLQAEIRLEALKQAARWADPARRP
jgi:hypothetical protein